MRSRLCNSCKVWSAASEWINGCPECGHNNQTRGHEIIDEIQPYRSMATGEMITSRKEHREHLKKHGLREVGNETKYLNRSIGDVPDCKPEQRKELIRAQVNDMTQDQLKRAIKKDVDFVKWNSRKD